MNDLLFVPPFYTSMADNLYQLKNINIKGVDQADILAAYLIGMIQARSGERRNAKSELIFKENIEKYLDVLIFKAPLSERKNPYLYYSYIANAIIKSKFSSFPGVGYTIIRDIVLAHCESKINAKEKVVESKFSALKEIFVNDKAYKEGLNGLKNCSDP